MNRNDVIDVLSVVAAATRRTVGKTDVEIWLGIIGDDDKQLALRAVREHLRDCPGVWLEPGHVHQRVRAIRRDELEREPDADREARQAALDGRFADQVRELAESKALPKFERPSKRHDGPNPLSVSCPFCRARIGRPCTIGSLPGVQRGDTRSTPHPSRIEAVTEAL
ncbi:hypothetical protein ACAG26_24240 [Mycobacterium sp. pUA109]|uniref:zinc finger domain-containing protein n=1 Tax=Mycobacterium sp. pUA109 TaxID=3238982 RepID=UPI00351ADDE1